EACFASPGALTLLELDTPRNDLRATYKYDARTTAGLRWQAELRLPASVAAVSPSLKSRLFHRRTRTFLTNWTAVERLDATRVSIATASAAVAAQAIPEQRDLEILLGQFGNGAAASACTALWSIPYAKYFLDSGLDAAFRDLTRPGHSRF